MSAASDIDESDESAPKVITLGCRLNAYESDVIRGNVKDAGLKDAVIINSCAVTNEAVRQTRQSIRRARKDNPHAQIIVTGCAAQIDPDSFAAMAEVDKVLGNSEKMQPMSFDPDVLRASEKIRVNDMADVRGNAPQLLTPQIIEGGNRPGGKSQARTRAFLQVQNGCDHRCTFCIIPFGRGAARSVPAGEVVAHVRALTVQGYKEVVLTGVDISSWGQDLPGAPSLGALVGRVLKMVPTLPRLRLSSIDPAEIDDRLFDSIAAEPRFMPYLHLSVQSGDDTILKRMKRRHSRADILSLCQRLRAVRPDITFGADIIAGFPTETEDMFENSLQLITQAGISWLHVFPYSVREGTPAAKMPLVAGPVIKARAAKLREAGEKVKAAHIEARRGQTDLALFEQTGLGRLADFTLVKTLQSPQSGTIAPVTLTGFDGEHAIGVLAG